MKNAKNYLELNCDKSRVDRKKLLDIKYWGFICRNQARSHLTVLLRLSMNAAEI